MMVVDAMGERDRRLWPDWYQEVDQQYLQNGSGEAALSAVCASRRRLQTHESARCTASSNLEVLRQGSKACLALLAFVSPLHV